MSSPTQCVNICFFFSSCALTVKLKWTDRRARTRLETNQKLALCKSYFFPPFCLNPIRRQSNTSAYLQSPLVCWTLRMLIGIFVKRERKYRITIPPPPVKGCQIAIFQIRLYLDNLLNSNRFPASRHITIGTSLLNKSDTEPSLCRRCQINVRHRANNISSASRVTGLSLGCYIGFISLSAGRGSSDEKCLNLWVAHMCEMHVWTGFCVTCVAD